MKYMLIDVTTVEGTRFLAVATTHEAPVLAAQYQQQGIKVIAPPLEGRGFAKLESLQLQYLLWNSTQIAPPEDYAECIRALLDYAEKLPVTEAPRPEGWQPPSVTSQLEGSTAPSAPRQPREPGERPKAGSTTGKVWDIADKVFPTISSGDWKAIRTAIINACTAEGINEATAATQYSKWKAAKLAAKAA